MLDKKGFGLNLALKIDISKAFDTLNFKFLLKLLTFFEFYYKFCNSIMVILRFDFLYTSIDGKKNDSFSIKEESDRMTLFLHFSFCLDKYVFCRGISNFIYESKQIL